MQVSNGIKLVPLPSSTAELPDILPSDSIKDFGSSEGIFFNKTIMIIDWYITPRFSKPCDSLSEPFPTKCRNPEFMSDSYEHFLRHLSLVSNCPIRDIMSWKHLDENEPLKSDIRGYTYSHYVLSHDAHSTSLSESQAEEAWNQYLRFKKLNQKVQEKLGIAIDRWIKSKNEGLFGPTIDRIIDLGIAFEVIYLSENSTEQLAYTFRLCAAWHLGNNSDERVELIDSFKKIYDFRSKAVHTGTLSKLKEKEVKETLDKADRLCRQAILKIINDGGFPKWDELVVGVNVSATQNPPPKRL